jgi:LysM repeat protein
MGFRFSSFLAGAAKGAADVLEEDQASAAKSASIGVKALKENYDKVMAENRTLETKLSKNMKFLKENDSTATDAELFAAATNDVFMQHAVEAAKANPGKFRVADFVSIKDANASKMTRDELMKAYTEIPAVAQAARQAEESSGNFIANLRRRVSSSAASKAEEQTAKAMGVSIEQLRAAQGFKRPEIDTGAEFDLTKFQKPKDIKEIKDQAQVDLLNAQESGDAKAINAAAEKIARINTNESIGKLEKKTEAQIQSDLITEIQEKQRAGDKQGAATATALLRQRQSLEKKPPAEGKTDADKISQSNLIQTATRTRATTIEQELPPGQLITNTDAQGNVTMTLRDLSQGALFRRGDAIAANAIIKEMSKPDGTPRSEMHKNAMMSAGIRFDDAGKAIRPAIPELPSKGTPPPPPPLPARGGPTPATPAPAAAPASVAPQSKQVPAVPQLTEQDKQALVWANNPANLLTPENRRKADAIKASIQQKLNVNN